MVDDDAMLNPPALPDRDPPTTAGLPHPFARSQLDGQQPAFALTPAGPVVSTDAWSGRQLALGSLAGWQRLTTATAWHRAPVWTGTRLTCQLWFDPAGEQMRPGVIGTGGRYEHNGDAPDDEGSDAEASPRIVDGPRNLLRLRTAPNAQILHHPALGDINLPLEVTVQAAAVAGDGKPRVALLLGRGSARRVVCVGRDGLVHLAGGVTALGPWLSNDEVMLVREVWPHRILTRWNLATGMLTTLLAPAEAVVDNIGGMTDRIGLSWTSTAQPRRLHLVSRDWLRAGGGVRLTTDEPPSPRLGHARPIVVDGERCALPCLVYEPEGEPRGTVVLLHGGPNGVHLSTWSPLTDSLVLAGWRVVRPNVRGSAICDPTLRPPPPDRYGLDDVADVAQVIRHTARDPVVLGGTSYGGYLAARTGAAHRSVRGVFVLGGFLKISDLDGTTHPQVRSFLHECRQRFSAVDRLAHVPHFVAHGARDQRIPSSVIARYADVLPTCSELIIVEDEGHGIATDNAARRVFPRLFAWLDRLA